MRTGALLLNHCITRPDNRAGAAAGGFIDRYVFPDGELTGSGRIITEAQDVGLEVVHEENLRHHYAMTLRDWCRNLVEHWDEAVEEVGLPTAKVWGLYMAGSRLGFETNVVQLHQVLAVKLDDKGGDGGLPLRPWWTALDLCLSGGRPTRSAVARARPPRDRGAVAVCSRTASASMLSSSSVLGRRRSGRPPRRAVRRVAGAVGDPASHRMFQFTPSASFSASRMISTLRASLSRLASGGRHVAQDQGVALDREHDRAVEHDVGGAAAFAHLLPHRRPHGAHGGRVRLARPQRAAGVGGAARVPARGP